MNPESVCYSCPWENCRALGSTRQEVEKQAEGNLGEKQRTQQKFWPCSEIRIQNSEHDSVTAARTKTS